MNILFHIVLTWHNIFKGQNSSVYDLHIRLSLRFAFDHTSFTVYFKNLFVYDAFDSFPETTISPNRRCRLNGQTQAASD